MDDVKPIPEGENAPPHRTLRVSGTIHKEAFVLIGSDMAGCNPNTAIRLSALYMSGRVPRYVGQSGRKEDENQAQRLAPA